MTDLFESRGGGEGGGIKHGSMCTPLYTVHPTSTSTLGAWSILTTIAVTTST